MADLSAAVPAAQRGEEDAFRLLYRTVQPGLLRYLQVLVGADAEDVASEAWLQVVRDLAAFRGDWDGFRGWVSTIARNRAIDHLRRQRRHPVDQESVEHLAERAGRLDTEAAALEATATDAALALIARLPADQAEAVLLRVVMGLDAKSVARVLGKRAGAVRTAAYRGLRKLAEYLDTAGAAISDVALPWSQGGAAVIASWIESTSPGETCSGVTQPSGPTLKDVR